MIIAKAIAAALTAGLVALGTAYTDGSVTPAEWIAVALAVLAGWYPTWQVPNKPALAGRHEPKDGRIAFDDDAYFGS